MKQALTELVDVILQRLEEHPDAPTTEHGIRSWLAGQGYNKRDIDAAIRLVGVQFNAPPQREGRTPGIVRQLSSIEAHKLTSESRDALARLELYELIDPYERELILDRVAQMEGMVSLEDLEYLLSWFLVGTRDVESQQTLFQVFEGRQGTLH
ncbi:MAG: DUF494 domain-containing protein [Candidatus Hydrogenedentes bacterium]|nr:DUF494 domain-containing protein [Candidatus Hydrogenedentota bacterium]